MGSASVGDVRPADLLVVRAALAAGADATAALRELDHLLIRQVVAVLDSGESLQQWLHTVDQRTRHTHPAAVSLIRGLFLADAVGAPAGPAIDGVMQSIVDSERVRRLATVRATQAVQSARFLISLPPIAGVLLATVDPEVRAFWWSAAGLALVLAAAVLVALALLWIRRLIASVTVACGSVDPLVEPTRRRASRTAATLTVFAVGLVAGGVAIGALVGGLVWLIGPAVAARIEEASDAEDRAAWTPLSRDDARHLPTVEAIELLALAVTGSTGLPLACRLVADACGGPTGETFRLTAARLSLGESALDAFPARLAEVSTLINVAHRWGAPTAEALRFLASDLRTRAASAAEEAAEGLGVRLVFPTTLLLVPAFGLVVVVPLAVSMLTGLSFGL